MIDLSSIPSNPGCYMYKDKLGKIIYVGKAKNLKKRVSSYFNKKDHDSKTKALVSNISSVDFLITDTEVEALILENNLIKKNKPKYNIDLKDSKRYAYIQLTSEEYPRLLVARTTNEKGRFYGPFVSASNRDYVLEALIRIFKIRTCKKLPKRECLRYSIGLCTAPCTNKISKEEYISQINKAEMILKGKNKELLKELKEKMREESNKQNYEIAIEIRNQIEAIENLNEKQKMELQKDYDEDLINYSIYKNRVYLMIFSSRKGLLENKRDFEFENKENFLEEFIIRYYSEFDTKIPRKILIPEKVNKNLEKALTKIKNQKVSIEIPKKGTSKELLDLVKKNVEIILFGDYEKIEDLRDKLKLRDTPEVIECFDISHLSGTSTVASMVQFRFGKNDSSNYRRYKIKTVNQIDDFASMKEVISRRYSKLKFEKLPFPNLIIIDGGKGQLSSALEEIEKLNIKIPIISLAKREEEVFIPGKSSPIILDKKSKALRLLQEIRDEAHRFAITYNRLLRKKNMFE